jgi:hypothetical protein
MYPASFDESNAVLARPNNMTDDECSPLVVFKGQNINGHEVVVSCWKATPEELAEINRTGRVWLVIAGETMQPAILAGYKPFIQPKELEEPP